MARIIHARIDSETEKVLREIELRLGWSDSQAVREGIKALRFLLGRRKRRAVIGQGKFRSGIRDLGSNKAHLEGFGQ
jgi:hypothetical protein